MSQTSTTATTGHQQLIQTTDDTLTIIANSIVAGILTNVLHEGVGHGLTALMIGANSGVLTTVAWSRAFDSRSVEAGGTLVNLAAALTFWLVLRGSDRDCNSVTKNSEPQACHSIQRATMETWASATGFGESTSRVAISVISTLPPCPRCNVRPRNRQTAPASRRNPASLEAY